MAEAHQPRFDLRRQNVYARKVLAQAGPVIEPVSLLDIHPPQVHPPPDDVIRAVDQVTSYDTQYTLQIEDIDPESEVYQLRLERNTRLPRRRRWSGCKANRPDVVIVPNGTIQELGDGLPGGALPEHPDGHL